MWGIGAAIGLTVYFFVSARVNGALPPIMLSAGGLLVGSLMMALIGLFGILPMEVTFTEVNLAGLQTQWWVALGGMIILSTVIAYVTGIMAARALGSKVASFISLTEVLFAVLWAWLLLGELPG